MKRPPKDVSASVLARLKTRAREQDKPFNEVLSYFVMERFLYRISQSEASDQFVLKGALMLQFWGGPLSRSTRDIDLLGITSTDVDALVFTLRGAALTSVADDGVWFDPETFTGRAIRLEANYDGVRVKGTAFLGKARVPLQVDVGFGDVITPRPVDLVYPVLLDHEAPKLLGYTPETAVAEKFEAIVALDSVNTRLKDFFDIWILARTQTFAGALLAEAIVATFRRRRTVLPRSVPIGLTRAFTENLAKNAQWNAFQQKMRIGADTPPLVDVAELIEQFVMPPTRAMAAGQTFELHWRGGGPWT